MTGITRRKPRAADPSRPHKEGFIARYNKRTGRDVVKEAVIGAIAIYAFFIGWWLLSYVLHSAYLPSPLEVWDALVDSFTRPDRNMGWTQWTNIRSSITRLLSGFALAVALAIPIGLMIGYSKTAEAAARPIIELFRPIPPMAWVPFLLVIMGNYFGPVITIFLGVFFPVLSNVVLGVRSVEKPLIDAAKTLGASKGNVFLKVIFPYTVPFLMAGVTIGLGVGWMCIVAAEMMGTRGGGLGQYLTIQEAVGKWDYLFAGMAVIAILGLIMIEGAGILERYISRKMGVRRK